jgi:anaerobic sulfite reductase subunit B
MKGAMVPLPYRVTARREETADTVTLDLAPLAAPLPPYAPGQFTMVYAFGVGEVPISISGGDGGVITHTVRAVGAVTRAVCAARVGDTLGLRGPFGAGWGVPAPLGADLVLVAGGIGLAPLRPVLDHALRARDRYRHVLLLVGARTPGDLLYTGDHAAWVWGGADVRVTVDRADRSWTGRVGLVTALFDEVTIDPGRTTAYVCGPELMMRFTADALRTRGIPGPAIRVSLERNMRCGVGWCGHCQLGPLLLCRDGPVVGYDHAAPLLTVKEL